MERRTFLRGLGACVALPAFESLGTRAWASAATRTSRAFPLYMAFVYHPNGVITDRWFPRAGGSDFDLSPTLVSLGKVRDKLQVLSGLDHEKAKANGDGAGDHARANATFLTGVQAKKTAGADIRLGISVDQLAAQQIGHLTRFPSLELVCDRQRRSGRCDSGYSCAYQYNLSWRSETTPAPAEVDPRMVFERLFGGGDSSESRSERLKRIRNNKSVLDVVRDDARRLRGRLGVTDRNKLDEYLASVRDIETQIEKAERFANKLPDVTRPEGIPADYEQHLRVMYDLMAAAFQTDSTRVATFLTAHDGSERNFRDLGVPEGHHQLSHHQGNQQKIDKLAKIDAFYIRQFAYFLEKLDGIRKDDESLLDNCMIVYGGGISDGNRHRHTDLPVLLAGGGGGSLQTGRHVRFEGHVPMTNLYLSMLERMGVEAEQFGDSTGRLQGIQADGFTDRG